MMLHAFTICSVNYLAYASLLHQSMKRTNPSIAFTVFLADEWPDWLSASDWDFPVVCVTELDCESLYDMAARYNVLEFNTSVKPFCFDYIFRTECVDGAIYLDPDILAVSAFVELGDLFAQANIDIVLTPHTTQPFLDQKNPDDLQMLKAGAYNLGFLALRNSTNSRQMLRWWGDHLKNNCVSDDANGLFVDQKFCDLVPSYFEGVHIFRNAGYNVAYWNLHARKVARDPVSGAWTVNGTQALRFFHFSGVDVNKRHQFSKYQDRHFVETIGEVGELLSFYLDGLSAFGTAKGRKLAGAPYFFGRLRGGIRLTTEMRQVYRELFPPAVRSYEEAFSENIARYLTFDPKFAAQRYPITRLMRLIWNRRPDLIEAFPIGTEDGRMRFSSWFFHSVEREYGLPSELVSETRAAIETARPAKVAPGLTLDVAAIAASQTSVRWAAAKPAADGDIGVDHFGYFRAASGVGAGARTLFAAMQSVGIRARAHEIFGVRPAEKTDFELSQDPAGFDCALFHMNADMTVTFEAWLDPRLLHGRYKIGFWVWELDDLPLEWARAYDLVDEIWCPSRFAADAIGRRTVKPVCVLAPPVPMPPPRDVAAARRRFGIEQDRLVCLIGFDASSYLERKNPWAGIEAFVRAFDSWQPRPQLVVKLHGETGTGVKERFLAQTASLRDVVAIDERLSASDVSDLQWACDIYISLHRAEGFGLWIAECMARGKACVVTNYSGNTDYARPGNSFPVGYSMVRVGNGQYPHGSGRWWAEPNVNEAVEGLQRLASDPELRRAIGLAARQTVQNELSLETVGGIAKRRLYQARAEIFQLPPVLAVAE